MTTFAPDIERPHRWPAPTPTNDERWAARRELYRMERNKEPSASAYALDAMQDAEPAEFDYEH